MPGHLLRRAQQVSTAIFAEALAEQDITSVQYVALIALNEFSDLDATRLAEMIAFDRATIGDVVERLERKHLIERRRSTRDGRAKLLRITPAGQEMLTSCHAAVERVQTELLKPLRPNERALFCRLLSRVARSPIPSPSD
jgi:DNA-binding MarR family transcriptional regulator